MHSAVAAICADIRNDAAVLLAALADTRPIHKRLFTKLTPPGYDYYAGNYRGDHYRCLRNYRNCIPGDERVSVHPWEVGAAMRGLHEQIGQLTAVIDSAVDVSAAQRLNMAVIAGTAVLVDFLTIHPYMDGNGHVARILLWSVLGRYGYWPDPKRWRIEPRTRHPDYVDGLFRYRRGQREILENFVLWTLGA
ncbi:MAG: Fic family protein [Phycisphaerae bacterium]|nr:Fic family protein [Phycisphaerae bacterium]